MDFSALTWNNSRDFLGNGLQRIFNPNPTTTYQNYSVNDASNLMQNDTALYDLGKTNPSGLSAIWDKFSNSPVKDQVTAVGGLIGGLGTAYNAYNNVKLGKAQLADSRDAWNKNYAVNASLTNSALADRQNARVASNSTAYQSVDSYMQKYGVK